MLSFRTLYAKLMLEAHRKMRVILTLQNFASTHRRTHHPHQHTHIHTPPHTHTTHTTNHPPPPPMDKVAAAISETAFSNVFPLMKKFEFLLKRTEFFLSVKLTITQHCFG